MQSHGLVRIARAASGLLTILAIVFAGVSASAATIPVTNANDAGAGSLRAAIVAANASVGTTDTITFAIAGTGPFTINLTSELDGITDPVIIDGYTQPGAQENTAPLNQPANMILMIELNGTGAGFPARGLVATNTGTQPVGTRIRGLAINRFSGSGIELRTGGVSIEGCFIGTDITGKIARGNGDSGIKVITAGGIGNTIGGTTTTARNIISANTFQNIKFDGFFASGSVVQGNYIGTDVTGTAALGGQFGVNIISGGSNVIGGTAPGAGNVISGIQLDGIYIQGVNALNNVVQGNMLGTNNMGTAALPNGTNAIEIDDAKGSVIGGEAAGAGNLLSGNSFGGVNMFRAKNTIIQGNKIGTDLTGTLALPNGNAGVILQQITTGTLVGGKTPLARNIISGNNLDGVTITLGSIGTTISGNYIGTDVTGLVALGNKYTGVAMFSPGNLVGGPDAASRNIICSNGLFGVGMQGSGAFNNTVQGNYIGLGVDGSTNLGNLGTTAAGTGQGIFIQDAQSNGVFFNVISANHGDGVFIGGASTNNFIRANLIGIDATTITVHSNFGAGVLIADTASNNFIGGTGPNDGNLIAYSGGPGVDIIGGTGNSVLSNVIGGNAFGIDLKGDGMTPNDALDADSGPNNLQNYPVLTGVTFGANTVTVQGTLNSTTNTLFRVEFFANLGLDYYGNGEGESFVGSTNVLTDANGAGEFNVTFNVATGPRRYMTCTATAPGGNTSEFSRSISQNAADSAWVRYH